MGASFYRTSNPYVKMIRRRKEGKQRMKKKKEYIREGRSGYMGRRPE